MSIYKKIHAIMSESEALEKNITVGDGKSSYKAIGEASVLNNIKPLLKKHGVIILPVEVDIKEQFNEYQGKYGTSQRFMSTLHAKYKIVDVDTGEFEILETVGYGSDSQDKGSGKAMTYAYKALIQKTFCLFSGEDTDNDHSDDITKKNTYKKDDKNDAFEDSKMKNEVMNKKIDSVKVKALLQIIDEVGSNRQKVEEFAHCKIEDMTVETWGTVLATLQKRKNKSA